MLENGFDERVADHELAIEMYKKALKLGNSDAAINIALIYLNVRDIMKIIISGYLGWERY